MGKLKRLILPGLLLVAVYFALFGGEYSWFDVRSTRARTVEEAAALDTLNGRIDSLRARADSLATDPAVLERIARENFGMIGEGEVLYRFTEPVDTTPPDTSDTSDPGG